MGVVSRRLPIALTCEAVLCMGCMGRGGCMGGAVEGGAVVKEKAAPRRGGTSGTSNRARLADLSLSAGGLDLFSAMKLAYVSSWTPGGVEEAGCLAFLPALLWDLTNLRSATGGSALPEASWDGLLVSMGSMLS